MNRHVHKHRCKCAVARCNHCKKHHDGPNGECTKCPPGVCRGWL